MMKILIVSQDRVNIREVLLFFDACGYNSSCAKSSYAAKILLTKVVYDCIILDSSLQEDNDLELYELIQNQKISAGIIVLSTRGNVLDVVNSLEKGADDYLTKPYHLLELDARLKAIVRRKKYGCIKLMSEGDLTIDIDAKQVFVKNRRIKLTKKEFEILLFLVTNKEKVITKLAICSHVWGEYFDLSNAHDKIYAHLKNIRRKIIHSGGKDYIETVHGMGYVYRTHATEFK